MFCLFGVRFDLIFLILDPQDELFDRRLAKHLVSLYHLNPTQEAEDHMVCRTCRVQMYLYVASAT